MNNNNPKVRYLKCLYTKQLTKKRKIWSDGKLKIVNSFGNIYINLLDISNLRETILESRQLDPPEIKALKNNEDFELQLESHLVSISKIDNIPENSQPSIEPVLKLPKFVIPSRYIPPNKQSDNSSIDNGCNRSLENNTSRSTFGSGKYQVYNDELDDIWDTNKPKVASNNVINKKLASSLHNRDDSGSCDTSSNFRDLHKCSNNRNNNINSDISRSIIQQNTMPNNSTNTNSHHYKHTNDATSNSISSHRPIEHLTEQSKKIEYPHSRDINNSIRDKDDIAHVTHNHSNIHSNNRMNQSNQFETKKALVATLASGQYHSSTDLYHNIENRPTTINNAYIGGNTNKDSVSKHTNAHNINNKNYNHTSNDYSSSVEENSSRKILTNSNTQLEQAGNNPLSKSHASVPQPANILQNITMQTQPNTVYQNIYHSATSNLWNESDDNDDQPETLPHLNQYEMNHHSTYGYNNNMNHSNHVIPSNPTSNHTSLPDAMNNAAGILPQNHLYDTSIWDD